MGGNKRASGGARSRFVGTGHHGDKHKATLRPDHPAVIEGRTLFPSTVQAADDPGVKRVLVEGKNNAKIGNRIEKGPWAGMPVYTLTLEERATCPRTCEVWASCYGNAMHMARRHAPGHALTDALRRELALHQASSPRGFAVRLHVLGDFYDADYVRFWRMCLDAFPALHVWGYTARLPGTETGDRLVALAALHPERWRLRISVANDAPTAPMQVTTIWRQPDSINQPEGSVCPQQFSATATCGTCGLCWAPANDCTRIVFTGHGMRRRGAAA